VHKPTTVVYGSTGGPKNIPPLSHQRSSGTISGTTGHRSHVDKEDIMIDPGKNSQNFGQTTQTTAPTMHNSQTRGFSTGKTTDFGASNLSQGSYYKESSMTMDKSSTGNNSRFKPQTEEEWLMDVEEIEEPKHRKRLNKLPSSDTGPTQKKVTKKK